MHDEVNTILTVSDFTGLVKSTLEDTFPKVSVVGEISNFKAHVSGHWYFTLKDAGAQVSCVMWRGVNNYVFFTPQDGMKVIANGRVTVYPPRGNYQLEVRSMKPAGEGELQAAFERLKRKLSEEGLFDTEHKKAVEPFPKKIGIVTAIGGAALRDMINIAERRYPLTELVIAPARVQGEGAADEIAKAIKLLNELGGIDLMIVGRGGGSLEDLWAFNEEVVARAIFDSGVPVISAVGHEVDFTIADFVADLRAPTPSAAMELATPNKDEIFAFISEFSYNASNNISDILERNKEAVGNLIHSYGFRSVSSTLTNKYQFLDNLLYKFQSGVDDKLSSLKNELALLNGSIKSNNVERILKRGFTIVKQNGEIIKRSAGLYGDKEFDIKFYDGEVKIGKE